MMSNNLIVNQQVVDNLDEKGFVVRRENLPLFINQVTHHVPWYLQALLGFGVLIAFILFLLLLAFSEFDRLSEVAQSIWAVGFIAIAILIYRSLAADKTSKETIAKTFAVQSSFLLMLTGKALLFYNVCHYLSVHEVWQATLIAAVIAGVTFPLYPVKLARILSLTCVLFLVLFSVPHDEGLTRFFSSFCFFGILLGLIYLSFSLRWLHYQYLRYALIAVVLIRLSISMELVSDLFSSLPLGEVGEFAAGLFYLAFMVAAALVVCMVYFAKAWRSHYGLWLLGLALFVLAYFLPATIFFALLVIVLGYGTRDKVMLTFGIILLPYYLFRYYYDLQITLLDKSYLLAASGVLLILVAAVIAKMGWYQENQS